MQGQFPGPMYKSFSSDSTQCVHTQAVCLRHHARDADLCSVVLDSDPQKQYQE